MEVDWFKVISEKIEGYIINEGREPKYILIPLSLFPKITENLRDRVLYLEKEKKLKKYILGLEIIKCLEISKIKVVR